MLRRMEPERSVGEFLDTKASRVLRRVAGVLLEHLEVGYLLCESDVAGLDLPAERLDVLAEMNAFQIEGRYPESLRPAPTQGEALLYMGRAEGAFEWLMKQL